MSDERRNLVEETINELKRCGLTPADVRFIQHNGDGYRCETVKPGVGSWEDFVLLAGGRTYYAGFGGAEVQLGLVVVGDDWWLERHEYDGSEWWEFKRLPTRIEDAGPLTERNIWDRWSDE